MRVRKTLRVAALMIPIGIGACSGTIADFRLVFGTGHGENAVSADLPYELAKQHFANRSYGLAAEHFRSVVARNPSSIEALNGLAASYDELGRFDLAERYYRRALALDPWSEQTLNNIGYSYLLQDKADLAAVYLREALAVAGEHAVIIANRHMAEAALTEAVLPADSTISAEPLLEETNVALAPRPLLQRSTPTVQSLVTLPQSSSAEAISVSALPSAASAKTTAAVRQGIEQQPLDDTAAISQSNTRLPSVEVSNGTGRSWMARRMSLFLEGQGVGIDWITNADSFNHQQTTIFYRDGWKDYVQTLTSLLPAQVSVQHNAKQEADIRIELGADLLEFDRSLSNPDRRSSDDVLG